jgi:hypothetical protein
VASVVRISSTSEWLSTNFARPPITAESKTLASAAIFTALFPPSLKILDDFFFARLTRLNESIDLRAQLFKKNALLIDGQYSVWRWKNHAGHSASPRDQDWLIRAQQSGRVVSKFTYRADSHVVTLAIIISG